MDAPRRVFRLIQLSDDWCWRLDIKNDDGLIGPFLSRDEAEKTLGRRSESGRARDSAPALPCPHEARIAARAKQSPRPALHARRTSATMRRHVRGLCPYHRGRPAVHRPAGAIRRPMGRATLRRRS